MEAHEHGEFSGIDVGVCSKHYVVRAVGSCDDCRLLWCADCLVPPRRKRLPTRCIECALIAAGVRSPGAKPGAIDNMQRGKKRVTKLF